MYMKTIYSSSMTSCFTLMPQESILEEEERTRHENKYLLITLRVLANIMVVIVLASSTYAIYEVVERSIEVDARGRAGESVGWVEQNMVSTG